MKSHAFVAVLLVLSGCASQIMGEMVGKDISQVVAQYGPPANVYDAPNGQKAFQWRMENSYVMPTTTTFNGYGSNYGYGSYVSGSATTTGGYLGTDICFYTLYAKASGKNRWTITGFEPPRAACE